MASGRWICAAVILATCGTALGERTIAADAYLDKLRGMWLGQILGNYAGRLVEGQTARGGLTYTIDWDTIAQSDPWDGDDDTCFEFLYTHVLSDNVDPTFEQIGQAWQTYINPTAFFIANRQARYLIEQGVVPPETGGMQKNMHFYAIDSQITTEALGAAAPGMRQRAIDLAGRFGSVTNEGYPVHAAQFYAAMYAAAALESDVQAVVAAGLEAVPQTSRTRQVVQDVIDWYADDKLDASLDWRATQAALWDKYRIGDHGRYRGWIESTVNTGATALAILYGQGDFLDTVEIGVSCGWDCDCNPATAGGLIGLIGGHSALPADLQSPPTTGDYLASSCLRNINRDTTITALAENLQAVAEQQIHCAGGAITGEGASRTYHLPDEDPVSPAPEKHDPAGPKGLVADVLNAGGDVTVSASVERHDPNKDRDNLDAVIDGIIDVSYNGHLPYWTNDGDNAQPPGGDHYQLNFDRDVTFASIVFYEGGILWSNVNGDPRVHEPKGGYFLNLTVEVGDDGAFSEVANLQLSEALDPFEYYQAIELAFHPAVGDAIRIRGDAGGLWQFTTIVELEAYGCIGDLHAGDANFDGAVNVGDLGIVGINYGQAGMAWIHGDFNGDGVVNVGDLGILGYNYGWTAGGGGTAAVPEPATLWLLAFGAPLAAARRRR